MFTATLSNQLPASPLSLTPFTPTPTPGAGTMFPRAQFTARANPETSFVMYSRYRDVAMKLVDTQSAELIYRVYENAEGSFNGDGMHEKFIYRGQSVMDVSVGLLDFPWFAADGNPLNEITSVQLQQLANSEQVPLVAHRLRALASFAATLPPYTRYYHYTGHDGVRALTISDEFNGVKMNSILTHAEDGGF